MLSDINLLPLREKRSPFFVIALTVIVAIGVAGAAFLYVYNQSLTSKEAQKQVELQKMKELFEAEQAKLAMYTLTQSIGEQYAQFVRQVERLPLQTVDILNRLAAALPEKAHVTSLDYTDDGKIALTIKYKQFTDSANYWNQLYYADWVDDVTFHNETKTEAGAGAESAQSTVEEAYTSSYTIQLNRAAFLRVKGDGEK